MRAARCDPACRRVVVPDRDHAARTAGAARPRAAITAPASHPSDQVRDRGRASLAAANDRPYAHPADARRDPDRLDLGRAGETEDRSGAALAEHAQAAGAEIVAQDVVPTTGPRSRTGCGVTVAAGRRTLIFTTGGTGLTDDDVTPEATKAVIDREAPGFAEAMRAEALRHTPMGILTRGVSGIAGRTLIINFPGNPKAIGELFPVIAPTLEHAVATLQREGGTQNARPLSCAGWPATSASGPRCATCR